MGMGCGGASRVGAERRLGRRGDCNRIHCGANIGVVREEARAVVERVHAELLVEAANDDVPACRRERDGPHAAAVLKRAHNRAILYTHDVDRVATGDRETGAVAGEAYSTLFGAIGELQERLDTQCMRPRGLVLLLDRRHAAYVPGRARVGAWLKS